MGSVSIMRLYSTVTDAASVLAAARCSRALPHDGRLGVARERLYNTPQAEGLRMTATDETLLARAGEGDRAAFAAFYDRHAARALGLLVKLLCDRAAAEDVLQETFLQVWSRAAQFDMSRGSPLVWLLMIARSRAADYRRRRTVPQGVIPDSTTAEVESPHGAVERSELRSRTHGALESLPSDQRIAIRLAFYEGLTHVEIAQKQELALGTVKTRIRLGMRRLRELLGTRYRIENR